MPPPFRVSFRAAWVPIAAGLGVSGLAAALWALTGGSGSMDTPARTKVPAPVFYVVWPAIYVSLALAFSLRPAARPAILAYVALSLAWIPLGPRDRSAGFLIILAMLWAALLAALAPGKLAGLLALPVAWTVAALILSS